MPKMNTVVSDIWLGPRRLTEIVSCRENGWNPYTYKQTRLLTSCHANTEPEANRKEK